MTCNVCPELTDDSFGISVYLGPWLWNRNDYNICVHDFIKWIPPPPSAKEAEAEEQITIDLGDEYEHALSAATQEEIIDLAGKLSVLYFSMCREMQKELSSII